MEEIVKMATRAGFLEVWWDRYRKRVRIGRMDTPRQIYEEMEVEHDAQYGSCRFPSWSAFKKYKNRHR